MANSVLKLLSRILRCIGLTLIIGVTVVGPYFRGLFFWAELLPGIAAVGLGFGLWAVGRRIGRLPADLPGGPVGWALLALTLIYLLLFPWAAFVRGNLDTLLRAAAAWAAFVAVRAEAGPNTRRWIAWTLLLGNAAVATVGLLDFTGFFAKNREIASALSLVGLSDRLFSVYQYPNTAAAVFMAAIIIGIGLALEGEHPWRMALAGAFTGVVSVAFFFTLSRGAVVVLPFGLIVLLAGLNWKGVWRAVLLLGAFVVIPIAAAMHGVARHLPAHNWSGAMKWVAVAVVVTALSGLALGYLFRLRARWQALVCAGLLAALLVGFVALRPAGPLIPKMASRLLDMNFRTVNVVLRLIYDQDAAKIVADHPLGLGGWGWERTYRRYQTFNYFVQVPHNHYAQIAVETGFAGLGALLFGLGASLWLAFRRRKEDPLRWSLAAAAALIAAHAAIDFDLSYLPVWLTLWIFLAAASPADTTAGAAGLQEGVPAAAAPAPRRWETPVALVTAVALAGSGAVLAVGARHLKRAEASLAAKNETAAREEAAAARRYDPWDSRPLQILGGVPNLREAVKRDPHNPQLWRDLTIALEVAKDFPGALDAARMALQQQPAVTFHYDTFARLAGFQLEEVLASGDTAAARKLGQELARTGAQLAGRKQVADPQQRWWSAPALNWTNMTYLHVAKGFYLTGDLRTAESYFKLAGRDWNFATEADVWLYAMYEQEGRTAELKPLEAKPWIRFRNANAVYKALKTWKP